MNGGCALDTAGAAAETAALAAFASPRTVRPRAEVGESRPACPVHRSPHPGYHLVAAWLFRLGDALTARAAGTRPAPYGPPEDSCDDLPAGRLRVPRRPTARVSLPRPPDGVSGHGCGTSTDAATRAARRPVAGRDGARPPRRRGTARTVAPALA